MRPKKKKMQKLILEILEQRTLLTVSWIGAGDGTSWSDPRNWNTDHEPGPNDDVVVNVPGNIKIVYQGNQPTVKTLENHDTIWVQGSDAGGNAVLTASQGITNYGTILLQSANNTYQSEINTGSSTLTNLGTISSGAGSGGLRVISGTLNNQATIDATADYLDITGVYQAQGGVISGSGYLVNCQLQETAAPASPSTIVVAGSGVTLATDNLAGYTLWVQGSDHGGNAVLQLGGSLANRGTILLQSANNTYQSEINTGSSTLTNLGTISSGAGSGGLRVISGTLNNQATIDATADYLDITGVYQVQGGVISGSGYLVNCQLQETAAPASPSTIVVAGSGVTWRRDNLGRLHPLGAGQRPRRRRRLAAWRQRQQLRHHSSPVDQQHLQV